MKGYSSVPVMLLGRLDDGPVIVHYASDTVDESPPATGIDYDFGVAGGHERQCGHVDVSFFRFAVSS